MSDNMREFFRKIDDIGSPFEEYLEALKASAEKTEKQTEEDITSDNMRESFVSARVSKVIDDIASSIDEFVANNARKPEELKAKAEKTGKQTEEEPQIIEDIFEPEELEEPKYPKVRNARKPVYLPPKKPSDNYSQLDIKGIPSNLIVIDDKSGEFKRTVDYGRFDVPVDEHRLILDANAVHYRSKIVNENTFEYIVWENTVSFEATHHFNPLPLCFVGNNGEIDDLRVSDIVNLIMESFFDNYLSIDEVIVTMLVYYILEEDEEKLRKGFAPKKDEYNYCNINMLQPLEGGRCLGSILKLVQEAKIESDLISALTIRFEDFFRRKPNNKTKFYYDTFLLAGRKTASKTLLNIAASLHYFSCPNYDYLTRTNRCSDLNLSVDNVLTQPNETFYLDLVIPNEKMMNFFVQGIKKMISYREKELRYKWFIGYCRKDKRKTEPYTKAVFGPFDCEEEAAEFYESATPDLIVECPSQNGCTSYKVVFKGKSYRQSYSREALVSELEALYSMEIWVGTH